MINEDDGVDLKWCRVATEKEIERVRELDEALNIVKSLDKAYTRLTDHIEQVIQDSLHEKTKKSGKKVKSGNL